MRTLRLVFAASVATLLAPTTAHAATIEIDPTGDLIAAVNALMPGDELVLGGGTYDLSPKFTIGVSGTERQPIVIRAKEGEVPIITRPNMAQNTINIEFAQYVELHDLEVMGGSHGIRINDSSFITIDGCHIHDTGDVAISANYDGATYEGLRLVRNHIHDTNGTGEGMYLGCNDNDCQMFNSLIAENYIHHTANTDQGDGIEIKEGSYNNVVRDNVIHDTNYPCLITYSAVGNGGPNILERNVMWNCGDHAIQSAADAVIRNNIIFSAAQDGIRCQPHQSGVPDNLTIVHNTVVKTNNNALRCSGVEGGTVLIANNALYAQNTALRVDGPNIGNVTVAGNAGVGNTQNVSSGFDDTGNIDTDFSDASYGGEPPNDVFPATGSLLIGLGDAAHVTDVDFNGTAREGEADVGAYKYDADGNPGWVIAPEPKDVSGLGGEGGSSGEGGGDSSGAGGPSGTSTGPSGAGSGGGGVNLPDDEGSCSCRTVGAPGQGTLGWLALAGVALIAARRRRR